jgi:hypothetical protein
VPPPSTTTAPSPSTTTTTTNGTPRVTVPELLGKSQAEAESSLANLGLMLGQIRFRAYNVQPGFIATERMAQDMGSFGLDSSSGAPPDMVAAVVTWIATDPAAAEQHVETDGRNLEAQDICKELNLFPGWPA